MTLHPRIDPGFRHIFSPLPGDLKPLPAQLEPRRLCGVVKLTTSANGVEVSRTRPCSRRVGTGYGIDSTECPRRTETPDERSDHRISVPRRATSEGMVTGDPCRDGGGVKANRGANRRRARHQRNQPHKTGGSLVAAARTSTRWPRHRGFGTVMVGIGHVLYMGTTLVRPQHQMLPVTSRYCPPRELSRCCACFVVKHRSSTTPSGFCFAISGRRRRPAPMRAPDMSRCCLCRQRQGRSWSNANAGEVVDEQRFYTAVPH